jgi:glycerophosphoryl diester phosphodiesterase
MVIAHRGAPHRARENTVAAFEAARELGADMVELDVRRTADGAMAVHHDAVLEDGRAIVELRASELPSFVPSLEAAITACAGMAINIEIKNWRADPDFDPTDALAHAVADLVGRLDVRERVLVSSFNRATIDAVHAADPAIPTGWLVFPGVDATPWVADVAADGHVALHPHHTDVTRATVAAAHAAGLRVNTWTVDDADRMRELAAWGVDGVVTNLPDAAVAVLQANA